MATVTVYLLNTAATAPNWFGKVQDNGTAPGGALSAFGWTVAKVALTTPYWRGRIGATARATVASAGSYIDAATGPVQGTGSGATTAGDSFRSDNPLNGTFAAGNWNFTFGMRTGAASNSGRIRCIMWASANANGTSPRKLTSATLVGTAVTMSTTTTTYNSTVTWAAPQVVLANEYLFLQCEWQSTVVGTSNSCTAQFYQASFVTPDYVYVPATGTLAITEANDTLAASGAVVVAGRLDTFYAGRASPATYFDAARNLQTAATDVQRYGYDQFTGSYLGTIIEDAGTNLIFNPRALAATDGVIGSGGAFPAGWGVWGAGADIIYTVSNQRVVNNVPLIDIRFTGPMTTAGYMVFGFDSTLSVGPNTPGTLSFNIALAAGSTTNLAVISNIRFSGGGASNLDITNQLRTTLIRATNTTTTPAGNTWVGACLTLTAGIGVPFDITLTLGLPQFETVGAATTYILPPVGTGAISTRAADVITLVEADDIIDAAGTVVDTGTFLTAIRYTDPDAFGTAVVGYNVTLTRYVDPDAFGTAVIGRGSVNLAGTIYTDPDTFKDHILSRGAVNLAETRYVDPDAFTTGSIISRGPVGLLGTRYADPDTFKAHIVGRGSIGVQQTRYTDLDTFWSATLVLGPPPSAALTAIRYVDLDTFNTHIIGRGPVGLIQTRYADPDTFNAHTVNRGPVGLQQVRYADQDLFGTATLILGPPPNLFLTATRFADPDTFKSHTIGYGLVNLIQTRYVDPDAFQPVIIGRGPVGLIQTRYVDLDSFYTYIVRIGIWYVSPARFVNLTTFHNHTVYVDLTQDLYAARFHSYSYAGGKGFVGIRSPISILGSQYAVHIGA